MPVGKWTAGLLLLVVMLAAVRVDAVCNIPQLANGCSIPGNIPFPFTERFREACNRHDVCYRCGSAQGYSRSSCDEIFLSDMMANCNTSWRRYLRCIKYAHIYYAAVRFGGSERYEDVSPYDCQQSSVRDCLAETH